MVKTCPWVKTVTYPGRSFDKQSEKDIWFCLKLDLNGDGDGEEKWIGELLDCLNSGVGVDGAAFGGGTGLNESRRCSTSPWASSNFCVSFSNSVAGLD